MGASFTKLAGNLLVKSPLRKDLELSMVISVFSVQSIIKVN